MQYIWPTHKLHNAAANGNIKKVQQILKKNNDLLAIDTPNKHGSTPLFLAALRGQEQAVKLLLDETANPNLSDNKGETALHAGVYSGKTCIIEQLLNFGANIDAINQDGETPLLLACTWGHEEIVKVLLENKANPNTENSCGQTPLKAALFKGYREIAALLHKAGAYTTIPEEKAILQTYLN